MKKLRHGSASFPTRPTRTMSNTIQLRVPEAVRPFFVSCKRCPQTFAASGCRKGCSRYVGRFMFAEIGWLPETRRRGRRQDSPRYLLPGNPQYTYEDASTAKARPAQTRPTVTKAQQKGKGGMAPRESTSSSVQSFPTRPRTRWPFRLAP